MRKIFIFVVFLVLMWYSMGGHADLPPMILEEVVVVGATDSPCGCEDINLPEDEVLESIPTVLE